MKKLNILVFVLFTFFICAVSAQENDKDLIRSVELPGTQVLSFNSEITGKEY